MSAAGPGKLRRAGRRAAVGVPAGLLLSLFLLPAFALAVATGPRALVHSLGNPLVVPAILLSLETTALSLALILVLGTPLAWWLARSRSRHLRWIETVVELPVVMPPAVVGVALLVTFGRNGLLGPLLGAAGISVVFTEAAVVIAQTAVAAPLYVQSAAAAFRGVDDELLVTARTLGASPARAFARVAVPAALPGLAAGAALAWARALGEFGATLLFAGNLPGRTQTLPLAIYTTLESDVHAAQAVSLVLVVIAFALLAALRGPLAAATAATTRGDLA